MNTITIVDCLPFENEVSQGALLTLKHPDKREVILTIYANDKGSDDPTLNLSVNQNEPFSTVLVDDSECLTPTCSLAEKKAYHSSFTFNQSTVLLTLLDDHIVTEIVEHYGTEDAELLDTATIKTDTLFNTPICY